MGYDSMFHNGESISDFRADLSGPDDWAQNLKAYKKAMFGHMTNKTFSLGELYDYETEYAWMSNGWKQSDGFNLIYSKDFFKNSNFEVHVVVPTGRASNWPIYRADSFFIKENCESIFMVSHGQGNYPANMTFYGPDFSVYRALIIYLGI